MPLKCCLLMNSIEWCESLFIFRSRWFWFRYRFSSSCTLEHHSLSSDVTMLSGWSINMNVLAHFVTTFDTRLLTKKKSCSLLSLHRLVNAEFERRMQVKTKSAIKRQSETKLLSRWTFMIFIRREEKRLKLRREHERKAFFESQLSRSCCYQQTW